jgi:hypothetical protein
MNQLNNNPLNANNTQLDQTSFTPYLGEMKSKDIGTLPYAGRVGGEMVRRMIKAQEEKLMQEYSSDQMKS